MSAELILAKEYRKKAFVISHERSGTHFLMNTLDLNFGYVASVWWNFDFNLGLNFFDPKTIGVYFRQFHDRPVLNILKSHHPVSIFETHLDYLTEQSHIFYVYRDPRDLMVSYWKFIQSLSFDEGPKTKRLPDFIRAEPCGAMLRYQHQQERNVLCRWHTHVKGWLDFRDQNPQCPICFVRYEQLNLQFESTVKDIASFIGNPSPEVKRPALDKNVIRKGEGKVGGYRDYLDAEDLQFFHDEVGDLMKRLNY